MSHGSGEQSETAAFFYFGGFECRASNGVKHAFFIEAAMKKRRRGSRYSKRGEVRDQCGTVLTERKMKEYIEKTTF